MSYSPPDLTWHLQSVGPLFDNANELRALATGTNASAAWPAANLCIYLPIYIRCNCTCFALWWLNGSTVSGNASMGLYDEGGNRIAQTGIVAQAGTATPQQPSITAFQLSPGRYWAGLACVSTSATMRFFSSPLTTDAAKLIGIGEETVTSGQVPATMNPVASSRNIPILGLRIVPQSL